jgi:paraquat-inducible protein A
MSSTPPRPASRTLVATTRLLVLTSAALLGLGLIAPCMTIVTRFGRFDSWVRLLEPEMAGEAETTYSLLGGILAMIDHGSLGIGLLLLGFSCVFPTLKLMLMAWATETLARHRPAGRLLTLAHHTGKFSMLDVMVVALLVLAIKGLPGSSELRLEWGVYAFAASVVLSLLASVLIHRLEKKNHEGTKGTKNA